MFSLFHKIIKISLMLSKLIRVRVDELCMDRVPQLCPWTEYSFMNYVMPPRFLNVYFDLLYLNKPTMLDI